MKQKGILVCMRACVCCRDGGVCFILFCIYIPNSFKKQPFGNEHTWWELRLQFWMGLLCFFPATPPPWLLDVYWFNYSPSHLFPFCFAPPPWDPFSLPVLRWDAKKEVSTTPSRGHCPCTGEGGGLDGETFPSGTERIHPQAWSCLKKKGKRTKLPVLPCWVWNHFAKTRGSSNPWWWLCRIWVLIPCPMF